MEPPVLKSIFTLLWKNICEIWDYINVKENNGLIRGFSSVQFSRSVVSDSLQPHESQHARPPCPSPTPGVYPDWRPSSPWCHPAISSSVVPFSSCPQSPIIFQNGKVFNKKLPICNQSFPLSLNKPSSLLGAQLYNMQFSLSCDLEPLLVLQMSGEVVEA